MKSDNGFVFKTPEDGKGYWADGELFFLKLHNSEIGGAYALFELTVPPYGPGPPLPARLGAARGRVKKRGATNAEAIC